jgi:hypothetical protein
MQIRQNSHVPAMLYIAITRHRYTLVLDPDLMFDLHLRATHLALMYSLDIGKVPS